MMKKVKRIVSLFLSLLIILFPSKAFAISEESVNDNTVSYDQFFQS